MDDRTKMGSADRIRINIHESYELRDWAKRLGVTKDALRALVMKHGVMVSDIERALGR